MLINEDQIILIKDTSFDNIRLQTALLILNAI